MNSSRYKASINTSGKILTTLMDNKEYAQYDMPEAIAKDYRTVLRHLKLLEDYGMIKHRKEPSKKGGKERKIFVLTAMGLMQALRFEYEQDRIEIKNIDQFADTYKELLPLIFGKWKLFKKYRLKDLVARRLWAQIGNLPDRLTGMPQEPLSTQIKQLEQSWQAYTKSSRPDLTTRSTHKVALALLRRTPERIREEERADEDSVNFGVFFEKANELEDFTTMQTKLFAVLRKDKDLETYTNEGFDRLERLYQGYLQSLRSWKQSWMPTNQGSTDTIQKA